MCRADGSLELRGIFSNYWDDLLHFRTLYGGVHANARCRAVKNWNKCVSIHCSCVDLYFPDDIDLWVNKPERSTGGYTNILYCIAPLGYLLSVTRNWRVWGLCTLSAIYNVSLWKHTSKTMVNLLDQNTHCYHSSIYFQTKKKVDVTIGIISKVMRKTTILK